MAVVLIQTRDTQAEEIAQELESKAPWVGTQGHDGPWAR